MKGKRRGGGVSRRTTQTTVLNQNGNASTTNTRISLPLRFSLCRYVSPYAATSLPLPTICSLGSLSLSRQKWPAMSAADLNNSDYYFYSSSIPGSGHYPTLGTT